MGVVRPYLVKTSNGESKVLNLADCVNIHRTPWVRDAILKGEYNRIASEDGKHMVTIEKPFFYTDFDRNHLFLVKPRYERHDWLDASAQLERMLKGVPPKIMTADKKLRVIFGMGELREKLVADEATIDDRMVELLKVLIIYDHPFLIKQPRLRLFLEKVSKQSYDFIACYDHHPRNYRVGMPRKVVDELVGNRTKVEKWIKERHKKENIFDLKKDHWVNFWRWSPVPSYLSSLKDYAKQLREGKTISVTSKSFKDMLKYLPRGSQLPAWAKKDLYELLQFAKKKKLHKLQDQLFELRFDRQLDDDWYLNDDPNDIDTLWKLMRDLPDTNVEGNTSLDELNLARGGGGWYEPDTGDIYIGSEELFDKERFEDVVRHEVGHAVHEGNEKKINSWLKKQFGWMTFDPEDKPIDAWVDLMGGYGTTDPQIIKELRKFLKDAIGPGSEWGPPKYPVIPRNHAWWKPDFGPRIAFENSGNDWYERNNKWHVYKGKAFFFNFYYQQFMVINATALDMINNGMPDKYAAMSPFEFFAELYALHYDMDDPMRKNIPKEVKDWLNKNVGKAASSQPQKPKHSIKRTNKAMPGRRR